VYHSRVQHRRKAPGPQTGAKRESGVLLDASKGPAIVRRTLDVFACWFRNGWGRLRNQHSAPPPHEHPTVEQVKASRTWSKGGWHLGNRQKRRGELDNQALPAGCQTLGRRREKADRSSSTNLDHPFNLVGLDPLQGGSEPGNQPLQCFGPTLAGSVAPERVRRDLALLVPARAPLAAVLSLHETGAIPILPWLSSNPLPPT
jgi:hypothetical protein